MILDGIVDLVFPIQNEIGIDDEFAFTHDFVVTQPSWRKKLSTGLGSDLHNINIFSSLQNPHIHNVMLRFKSSEYSLSDSLSSLIVEGYKRDATGFVPPPDLITCVPSDPKRLKRRGYHPAWLITSSVARQLEVPAMELLTKKRSTPPQSSYSREDRIKHVDNLFTIPESISSRQELSKIDNLWIIDDVVTTGATLAESAKVIHQAFPNITIHAMIAASN